MDWFQIPPREYVGGARESHRDAEFGWEYQCGDNASHSSQLQPGVRYLFSDIHAYRYLLLDSKAAQLYVHLPVARSLHSSHSFGLKGGKSLCRSVRSFSRERKLRCIADAAGVPRGGITPKHTGHPRGDGRGVADEMGRLLLLVAGHGFLGLDLVGVLFQSLGFGQEGNGLLDHGVPIGHRAQT